MAIVIQSRSSNRYAVEARTFTGNINEARTFESVEAAEAFILSDIARGSEAEYDNQRINLWVVADGKKIAADQSVRMRLNADGPSGHGW